MVGSERQAVIHVRGMTANTEENQIKEAICREVGAWEPCFAVKQIRPMRGDTRAATLVLSSSAARKLLDLGHIKVGLARCEVEKRYVVKRCQRCWSFTHELSKCTGPYRTGHCLKCGKHGHIMEGCEGEEYCVLCSEPHRHGSGKCSAFRDALQRARATERGMVPGAHICKLQTHKA
uniref:Uncharacterized protein LOC114343274 n=1 Tax=Diabrotica virgifera virgifera TaxID=50390 RepID=A0A6P7GIY6_DIAVI